MNGTYDLYYQTIEYDTTNNYFPVVEFKINEGAFCEKFDDNNITPLKGEYILINEARTTCSSTSVHF